MSFKDELQNLRREADRTAKDEAIKKRIKEQKTREPIPEAELKILAESMVNAVKEDLRKEVKAKNIQSETIGLLGLIRNYRYSTKDWWELAAIDYVPERPGSFYHSEHYPDYGLMRYLPETKYFDKCKYTMHSDVRWPTNIIMCVPCHLEQLLEAVRMILAKDGCIASWSIEGNYVRFSAYIKCDAEGNLR